MGIAILITAITIYAVGIFNSERTIMDVLAADFETTGFADVPTAILNAFTYAGFQCVTLPTMVACGTTMKNKQGCAKAMWLSFIMNAVSLVLSCSCCCAGRTSTPAWRAAPPSPPSRSATPWASGASP